MVDDFNNIKIAELERKIALLPGGSMVKKNIRGKDYYYHRITRDGKRTEKYVSYEDVDELKAQIEKRRHLQKELKELKSTYAARDPLGKAERVNGHAFKTTVRTGKLLEALIDPVRKYRKRECIKAIRDYIFGESHDKVLILYGLRRTGKTTLVRQILTEMSQEEFAKAAFANSS